MIRVGDTAWPFFQRAAHRFRAGASGRHDVFLLDDSSLFQNIDGVSYFDY